jgi:hypothetical protein
MEHESKQDHGAADAEEREREQVPAEQSEFHPPFASEGLEQIRDGLC